MKKLLILCTGNSCRSQMAHGYFNRFYGKELMVYSAGIETHGVNPRAVKVMAEDEVDISKHTSNNVKEYEELQFDWVLTVCDHALEVCPVFQGKTKQLHLSFNDPAKATGSEEEILASFRQVRDQIKSAVQKIYAESF